jgi:xanthine dehydrogenase accessory factor
MQTESENTDDVLAVLDSAARWQDEGGGVALATVVETWGSSPRPVGSQMAIARDGQFAGSVSGGCVEGAVVEAGIAAIDDGKPRLLRFGVSDDDAWSVGLACGGTVRIYVEPIVAS